MTTAYSVFACDGHGDPQTQYSMPAPDDWRGFGRSLIPVLKGKRRVALVRLSLGPAECRRWISCTGMVGPEGPGAPKSSEGSDQRMTRTQPNIPSRKCGRTPQATR
jgi:hypothetical protein